MAEQGEPCYTIGYKAKADHCQGSTQAAQQIVWSAQIGVWLRNDLDEEHKLLLASIASALLLRSDLADHNDPST